MRQLLIYKENKILIQKSKQQREKMKT